MADTVPSPQQSSSGTQNLGQTQAPVQNQVQSIPQQAVSAPEAAPSIQQQAINQTQQTIGQVQQAGQQFTQNAQQTIGQVQQTGQQFTQGAQQVMGQANQVAGQANQAFSEAAKLFTAAPAQPQPPVTQEEKIWAALSYIPMVALIAFLIKPKSDYVKLHGRQGLLIFLIFFFSIFLYIILSPLGPILAGLAQFGMFVIGVYSIYQALIGNWWKIPVLGQIADMIPVELFTNVATQAITGQEPVQNPPGVDAGDQQNQPLVK